MSLTRGPETKVRITSSTCMNQLTNLNYPQVYNVAAAAAAAAADAVL